MRSNACLLLLIAAPLWAETPVTVDLTKLSAEAKQELLKKKERFEQLSADEQARLRNFHSELAASPDAPRLEHVLTHYHDWLRTLKPLERDELLSLPAEQRIERIRKLMQEQEKQRFRQMAENVPPEDLEVIVKWLEDLAEKHREQLVAEMPSDVRRRWESIEDPARKRWMLVFGMRMRPPGEQSIMPTQEDFARLTPQLSAQSQEQLKKTPQSGELIKEWIRAAFVSKWNGQISNEKLSEFFRDLPATDRERLERLPADKLRGELMRMYFAQQHRRDGFRPWLPPGGPGGPSDRGPGEGRGPGPGPFVRPDGSRPGGGDERRPFRGGPRPEGQRPPAGPEEPKTPENPPQS